MERKIEEYLIIRDDPDKLEKRVYGRMVQGWQPFGTPFTSKGIVAQAMVKYADEDLAAIKTAVDLLWNTPIDAFSGTNPEPRKRFSTYWQEVVAEKGKEFFDLEERLREAAQLSHQYRDETERLKALLEKTESSTKKDNAFLQSEVLRLSGQVDKYIELAATSTPDLAKAIIEVLREDNDNLHAGEASADKEIARLQTLAKENGDKAFELKKKIGVYRDRAEQGEQHFVEAVIADVRAENGALKTDLRAAGEEIRRLEGNNKLSAQNLDALDKSRNAIETERDTLKISRDVLLEALKKEHYIMDRVFVATCDTCKMIKEFEADG